MTKAQRREYYSYLDNMVSMKGVLEYAVDKAKFDGRKEGILETARNMKSMGISSDLIMAATKLTLREIETL